MIVKLPCSGLVEVARGTPQYTAPKKKESEGLKRYSEKCKRMELAYKLKYEIPLKIRRARRLRSG